MFLKAVFGIKSMKEDSGSGNGHTGEFQRALSGLFDEANGAAPSASFGFGCHGMLFVEDGWEMMFVEGGGHEGSRGVRWGGSSGHGGGVGGLWVVSIGKIFRIITHSFNLSKIT